MGMCSVTEPAFETLVRDYLLQFETGIRPADEDDKEFAKRLAVSARKEQVELVEALRAFANLCDGDLPNVGGGTSLGFDGRLTAGMIKQAKQIVARFP